MPTFKEYASLIQSIFGNLNIEVTTNNHILMIGTAKKVYEGVLDIKNGK